MAIRMEDRFPILAILNQTPAIPANCQWAIFLRNHDELTLEMVTDDERDYMYRMYANDRQMRINLGIRRRLAGLKRSSARACRPTAGCGSPGRLRDGSSPSPCRKDTGRGRLRSAGSFRSPP